ncbi:MAG: WG repeat-containing protein, partial [Candidatus Berkelbacteria bacterium]|nr:WG repeat-containing protein [Candidatus Berkelbacteria bacterium]
PEQHRISNYYGQSENNFCIRFYGQSGYSVFLKDSKFISAGSRDIIDFSEGLAVTSLSPSRYRFIDEEGNNPADLGTYRWADNFHEGIACVRKDSNSRYVVIDRNGDEIQGLTNLLHPARCCSGLVNVNFATVNYNLSGVGESSQYAYYADKTGRRIESKKNKFCETFPFSQGRAFVSHSKSGPYYLIDEKFEKVSPFSLDSLNDLSFRSGFAMVSRNDKTMIINTDCKPIYYWKPGDQDAKIIDDLFHIISGGEDIWLTKKGTRVRFGKQGK